MSNNKTLHELPKVEPRESNFTLDWVIEKLSAVNNPDSGVHIKNDHAEIWLCLANEIKKIKSQLNLQEKI